MNIPAAKEPGDILIVEDSRTQSEQLKFMLERHGYATRHAQHGVEALVLLRESKPLLVVSDITMPEMDGYELCRRIRADPTMADLPVILLTSLSDPDDVVVGLEAGADNFVIKPPDEAYLVSRIRYIMANRHLRSLESTRISLEIQVGGRKHFINADRLQMLHLLLSTYESAVLRSKQLVRAEEEMRRVNESLEQKVRERTAALTTEIAERKRLHEELRQSEEKYRRLFASNPMPVWVFDIETLRFLAINEAAIRHYGYSREEFLGMTILDIRPPEAGPAVRDDLEQPLPNLTTGIWSHRKKNGQLIDVEITAHELDFEGRPARLVLAKDITEQKRVQEALRESEARFRQLAETIEDVFWSTTPDYQAIVYVSPAFERVWGRSLAELHATPTLWLDAIHHEDRSRVIAALESLARGIEYEIEYRIFRPNAEARWILDRGFALRDDNQRVYRTVGVARDITKQKLAEGLRRRSEARFAAMFNAAPVAITIATTEGRLIDVNPELCSFFAYQREELIERTTSELLLWAEPEVRRSIIDKLVVDNSVRNHEVKFRRKSGEIRSALVSMEMLHIEDESLILTMIVDVTDRKALEAQLRRVQRVESVGLLASGIAHDMNNILAPIMMSAPLLRMGMPPSESEKLLSTIETSAQRGAALVRQLLIFGRGVEGGRRPVNISAIIAEVAKISAQTFPRSIRIAAQVNESVWRAHGDATQLHQVLLNLCVNARDAMPEGGELTLSAENTEIDEHFATLYPDAKPGRYVLIRIIDTGTGISPKIMDRIFDPFFTTKEAGKGTGLGLSTVLAIVKSHGGFMQLHSEPGHGTAFQIYVPASAKPESASPFETSGKLLAGHGEVIMVVDDEENIRAVLRDTFACHNYNVVTAQDGVEATAVFAANPAVKLVVTDLDMPVMDGINLARVLRRMNPEIRFVISTGLGGRSGASKRQKELDELGITVVLTKPYTAEKLLRVVHGALAKSPRPGPA